MRSIAVVGPSQSGKTSLVKALAGLEGGLYRPTSLTSGTSLVQFEFMNDSWTVLDIPGGQDSIALVAPALASCDVAILCVPAAIDDAVLASPYLRLLEESDIPTILFLNKIDSATDRVADIVAEIQNYCAHAVVLRQVPMREGGSVVGSVDLISERAWQYHPDARSSLVPVPVSMEDREKAARNELLESLADFDDALLEQIIEDQIPPTEIVYDVATKTLQHHELVPTLLGSASLGNGAFRLMKSLRHEAPDVRALRQRIGAGEAVIAVSAMADHFKHIGKVVLIRGLTSDIRPGAPLCGSSVGGLNAIDMKTAVPAIKPGEFAFAIKSEHVKPAHLLTADGAKSFPEWAAPRPPLMRKLVQPVHEKDDTKLATAVARLVEIDPGVSLAQDETTGALKIGVQGQAHLQRLLDVLSDTFGIAVGCEDIPSALRETIRKKVETHHRHRKQSGGAGQFADVVVDVYPRKSGSGFAFDEVVKGGAVPRNYIPSVEAGARDATAAGPEGYPVVDIGVKLKDGKSHSVDSSDFAFRTAGQHAVKEALTEAGTVVLQPIMRIELHLPSIFSGSLVQLVSSLKGQILGFEPHPTAKGWDIFWAHLPMSSIGDLARQLGSATRGTAWYSVQLERYEELRLLAKA